MDFKINIDETLFQNGTLENPIFFNGFAYVLLELPEDHPDYRRNVWKLDEHSNIVWKVNFDGRSGIWGFTLEDGQLLAHAAGGQFRIDWESGETEYIKMIW